MIKGVIFDLDDTLYPEEEYVFSGFMEVCTKISNDFDLDYLKLNKKIKELYFKSSKMVFNRLLDFHEINYNNEYINLLINHYRSHKPNIKLFEDADVIIKYLYQKGIKMGLVTDGYATAQRRKIEALQIKQYFSSIIITDELGKDFWKPHELPFKTSLKQLKILPEEAVYIGDNVGKDFIAPNKLGMKTIYIARSNGIYKKIVNLPSKNYAQYEIKHLTEIPKLINLE